MLVLSRCRDQTIMIGDNIEITIVDIRGDKVRLGIRAPSEVSVHRKEVWEAIRRENQSAGKIQPQDIAGAGSGEFHVIRGASWRHGSATELRLAFRDYGKEARADLGFRLARYAE